MVCFRWVPRSRCLNTIHPLLSLSVESARSLLGAGRRLCSSISNFNRHGGTLRRARSVQVFSQGNQGNPSVKQPVNANLKIWRMWPTTGQCRMAMAEIITLDSSGEPLPHLHSGHPFVWLWFSGFQETLAPNLHQREGLLKGRRARYMGLESPPQDKNNKTYLNVVCFQ